MILYYTTYAGRFNFSHEPQKKAGSLTILFAVAVLFMRRCIKCNTRARLFSIKLGKLFCTSDHLFELRSIVATLEPSTKANVALLMRRT